MDENVENQDTLKKKHFQKQIYSKKRIIKGFSL